MAKYGTPSTFFTQILFYQNDSEWPEMDFKHNFKNCNERLAAPPPSIVTFVFLKASLTYNFHLKVGAKKAMKRF